MKNCFRLVAMHWRVSQWCASWKLHWNEYVRKILNKESWQYDNVCKGLNNREMNSLSISLTISTNVTKMMCITSIIATELLSVQKMIWKLALWINMKTQNISNEASRQICFYLFCNVPVVRSVNIFSILSVTIVMLRVVCGGGVVKFWRHFKYSEMMQHCSIINAH